jgi:hypothetical protein
MKTPDPNTLKVVTRTLKGGDGYEWTTHRVEGRDDNGNRIRRCFKDRKQADAFVTAMRTKLLNAQTAVTTAVTRLTPDQLKQAESAFARLGSRYTLDEAVSYFVDNYAAPDEVVTLKTAVEKFSEGKDDVRKNTLRNTKSTLQRFRDHVGEDTQLHLLTADHVRDFLGSLRSKAGDGAASKKTWNNQRNDISSLLEWCMKPGRRWVAKNVAREVVLHPREMLKKMGTPDTLTAERACELMAAAAKHSPSLAKAYALMLFAGIRPDDDGELFKLARHAKADKLINTRTKTIHIEADISKVHESRKVVMPDNLVAWLNLDGPFLPTNAARHIKAFRVAQGLTQDVCRHTFCTFHVTTHGSLAKTAMEAGNSEKVIRQHYYRHATTEEAAPFWRIVPHKTKGAVIAPAPAGSRPSAEKSPKNPPQKKAKSKK